MFSGGIEVEHQLKMDFKKYLKKMICKENKEIVCF